MKGQTETKQFRQKNIQTQDYLGKTVWVWIFIFCLNHVDNCLNSFLHSASVLQWPLRFQTLYVVNLDSEFPEFSLLFHHSDSDD